MSATILYMSMSLDGFIAGPNERPGNGLGDGGHRLHEWCLGDAVTGVNAQVIDEYSASGAIVAGRGTFEPADGWGGDHHGVPIFILYRDEPGIDISQWPLVSPVPDITLAIARAKAAAGDRNVLVQGATTAQLALAAGLLDEIVIHLVPVLFGQGRRLFDNLAPHPIDLDPIRILNGEHGVTHLHYRVEH